MLKPMISTTYPLSCGSTGGGAGSVQLNNKMQWLKLNLPESNTLTIMEWIGFYPSAKVSSNAEVHLPDMPLLVK